MGPLWPPQHRHLFLLLFSVSPFCPPFPTILPSSFPFTLRHLFKPLDSFQVKIPMILEHNIYSMLLFSWAKKKESDKFHNNLVWLPFSCQVSGQSLTQEVSWFKYDWSQKLKKRRLFVGAARVQIQNFMSAIFTFKTLYSKKNNYHICLYFRIYIMWFLVFIGLKWSIILFV